ncbi:MAG: (2Fe-2S)-binding protein, partial [Betaproteobacteria bacterium]|nr:(2Fe-2S)-binding protein [Betaproteobacteria bacterium]
ALRRPQRFGKYSIHDMPPIPSNHRERENYKQAQYAPGDYEAIISQRPIAVHKLENPTKLDAGLYLFRKMLRDAVRGTNPAASPQNFAQWLRELGGTPNSFCSGNVFDLPLAATTEEEIARRRRISRGVVNILIEAESMQGDQRTEFVRQRMEALEREVRGDA